MTINMNHIIGSHNIVLITLDTLRWDVAAKLAAEGRTPNLTALLPGGQWEKRHSPGSFTWAAHQSFFAGFLPTPITPGPHPRLFAPRFPGSETATERTFVFDAPDIVTGLADAGYHTICIGGVGFFNKLTPLGQAMPNLFADSRWAPELGVTDPDSTGNQVRLIWQVLDELPEDWRFFLFLNISAIHQPNRMYLPTATCDSLETHAAALEYVDRSMAPLWSLLAQRGKAFTIICSDHGSAYGEDGYFGHRLAHPVVYTVPYAEFILP